LHKPATKYGELEIRFDDCNGKVVASGSLEPAVANYGLTPLPNIELPSQEGQHDICFTFTRAKIDPIWAIGGLELIGY
jgi:hexosaminidase